ncbi:MAG: DUF924 family protein [Planctomycetota bacterium]
MASDPVTPHNVCAFWFGPIAADGSCEPGFRKRWWAKDADFDREVSTRFGESIRAAEAGEPKAWQDSAQGCLALVLLCDQMTRNSRRDQASMYAADDMAVAYMRHAIDNGFDKQLRTIERYFLLMPLMHAESLSLQQEGIERFDQLVLQAEPGSLEAARAAADYMRKHEVIVARFGRFPHRNTLLGRESTPDEVAFLQEPGSSF